MDPNEREREVDQWLDSALRQYGKADARPGLEIRVLANLKAERDRIAAPHRWWWALGNGRCRAGDPGGSLGWTQYSRGEPTKHGSNIDHGTARRVRESRALRPRRKSARASKRESRSAGHHGIRFAARKPRYAEVRAVPFAAATERAGTNPDELRREVS